MEKTPTELLIKTLPKSTKVLFGTVSGMLATAMVHPLDVIKVRLQLREKKLSTTEVARLMVKCEGVKALYAGLSAGLMRQATYTTTRLSTYHLLNDYYKREYNVPKGSSLSTHDKVVIGIYAGLLGALVGNPSEVALVRMMADGPRLCSPCPRPRRYRSVFHAFYCIVREDGIRTLWRGSTLTLSRAMLVSVAQIGTYAEVSSKKRHNDPKGHTKRYIGTKRRTVPLERSRPLLHSDDDAHYWNPVNVRILD
ncbi:mitochondrial 2-oxoglutarate/malate carrier protein-like isoform X2 [Ostrinia nubilalis]|uniref:mitochondrial 2-oxoglutarate/malate carrier protein-like isoform X2 n=1 Tax=Ostrinia nubilalis TaxID=29057 RepID=UPI003082354D